MKYKICEIWLIVGVFTALGAPRADAGDYYTYRDSSGRLVLSNSPPPPGRTVLNKQTLPEITDRELAEARALEQSAAYDNRLSSLEASVDELQYNTRSERPAAEYVQPDNYVGGDVAVGVGGPVIIRRPWERPVRPPLNSKNESNRPPRAGPPAPRSAPGGTAPPAGSVAGGRMG
jgi:uncharacterized protein DUF4124